MLNLSSSGCDPQQTRGGLKTRSAARPAVARCAILTIGCRTWHRHCALARYRMKRRTFIMLLCSATAWPHDTLAQQRDKVWRMGFIAHGPESFYDALFEGLRDYGYEEGRNLIVERRYAHGAAERFKEFAVEMVRLNVDIIIVVTTPAALAVMNATKTIPIVHPNAI